MTVAEVQFKKCSVLSFHGGGEAVHCYVDTGEWDSVKQVTQVLSFLLFL